MRRSAAALAAAVAVLVALLGAPAAHAEVPGASTRYETIEGAGGTPLRGFVVTPIGRGDGPFPLLVMPASWGMPGIEYVGAAAKLAYESGYTVVSYSSRGFWDSGGEIDIAGKDTVDDVSRVIDWAVEHADADPERVGVMGISYGAGTSLLAAAKDDRVKAVAALSTWTDLPASLYPNETVNQQAGELLLALAHLTGRPGPVLRQVEADYRNGDMEHAVEVVRGHSPTEHVEAINERQPAVMLANAWDDSMFPPSTLASFYDELTGPKKLMLGPGDHSTQEAFGAAGLPNHVWDTAARWMRHHVAGEDNGIDDEDPVQLKSPRGDWTGYPSWSAATSRTETLYLGPDEELTAKPATDWHQRVSANVPTAADSGPALVTGTLQSFGLAATTSLPLVSRKGAGVWTTDPLAEPQLVSGAPELRATVTPTVANVSLFAYLYDVNAAGVGELVTHEPYTVRDATPGKATSVNLELEPITWQVPAGHRLALVVDTVDPRYQDASTTPSKVEFTSPTGTPARLTVPLNEKA